MTLQHFRVLSQNATYRHLLLNGVCVAERKLPHYQVLLFQISELYVEVYFSAEGDELLYSRSFENTDELEPYLNSIDIAMLLAEIIK